MKDKKKHTIIGIIQARMGSKRLPGKTLKPILGTPMLEHLLNNLNGSKYVDKFVVATSELEKDNAIEKLCNRLKVDCFRGNELDVLSRFKNISDLYKANLLVRLTGDNPFVDRYLVDYMLKEYLSSYVGYDYLHNIENCNFPYGLYVEVFTAKALSIASKSNNFKDKEHVTWYIRRNKNKFKTVAIKSKYKFRHSRLTVDNEEDFIAAENIMRSLELLNKRFSFHDLIISQK